MTTFLLVIVIAALVLAPALFKENRKQLGIARVVLSLLALTLVILRFTTLSNAPVSGAEQTSNRYWTVGWKFGELIATTYPDGGQVHVIQSVPISPGMQAMQEAQMEGLEAGIGRASIDLVLVQPTSRGPETMGEVAQGTMTMAECLKASAESIAVVSFINLPLNSDLAKNMPPAYVMDDFSTGYWICLLYTSPSPRDA